ncbi:MAG: DUF2905 domain-containing protein [Firmicutes bacterium]|nr:DUF2905 domain-containing protein [Bacillota bacterium]
MPDMEAFGKILLLLGGVFLVMGLFLTLGGRFLSLGRLPGDIYIKRGNFTLYFPIVTGLLLSIILTLLVNIIGRR